MEEFLSSSFRRHRLVRQEDSVMGWIIAKFNGKEVHPGLGASFREWGENFIEQLVTAQAMVEQNWPEDLKIQILGSKLDAEPLIYFNQNRCLWRAEPKARREGIDFGFCVGKDGRNLLAEDYCGQMH
jgi:hypothetical protein